MVDLLKHMRSKHPQHSAHISRISLSILTRETYFHHLPPCVSAEIRMTSGKKQKLHAAQARSATNKKPATTANPFELKFNKRKHEVGCRQDDNDCYELNDIDVVCWE